MHWMFRIGRKWYKEHFLATLATLFCIPPIRRDRDLNSRIVSCLSSASAIAVPYAISCYSALRYTRTDCMEFWKLFCPRWWGIANSWKTYHCSHVIMSAVASQITSITIVYLTVYSGADQRKYQSSAPLAFVRLIHQWSLNSPHTWPVTRKMFPFNDVIMRVVIHSPTIQTYMNGNS